ncbi:MAG: hypothetical protein GY852_12045, partial [bacterium]|nr:hypothetical protein [bacterium]
MEDRRKEVDELLRSGSDDKLLLGNTDLARDKIEKAYTIASSEPPLPQPWRAVAAYRLGHLILRTAKTKDDLEHAEQYLLEASRVESLGPLPSVYRLPVLFRLKPYISEEIYESQYQQTFEAAKRKVEEMRGGQSVPQTPWMDPRLQGGYFNLLEFAAYFAGIPYSPLEGLGGDPYKDLFPDSSAWILVGHDKTLSS